MTFIKKLQNQPEGVKKIILWSVIIVLALVLLGLWFFDVRSNLKNFPKEEFIKKLDFPAFDEKIEGLESIEMPEINEEEFEEELKKFEEMVSTPNPTPSLIPIL